jgi:hypothetical protein
MCNAQHRLKRQAGPGHPPFEELRILRREVLVLADPAPAGRTLVADRPHVQHLVAVSTGFPGHQQTVGRRALQAYHLRIAQRVAFRRHRLQSVCLEHRIGDSILPRNPTVSLSRMFVRCNR